MSAQPAIADGAQTISRVAARPLAPDVQQDQVFGKSLEELEFYGRYEWCLDPHLTAADTIDQLRRELEFLAGLPPGWQAAEVTTNVFLLSCALLHVLEEAVRGPTLKVPRRLSSRPLARRASRLAEVITGPAAGRRAAAVAHWADRLRSALHAFLCARMFGRDRDGDGGLQGLASVLSAELPDGIGGRRIGVPSPYRRLDLTPQDSIALGRRFIVQFPDRAQPVLLIGLRTSGSYFAPLVHALLESEGYVAVSQVTIQPEKGPGRRERQALQSCARRGFLGVILDDSPHSGDTVLRALDFAKEAGFIRERLRALLPLHLGSTSGLGALHAALVIPLLPAEWHKSKLLKPDLIEARLAEYYGARGFDRVRVQASRGADAANAELKRRFSGHRGSRLKRVFEVRLEIGGKAAESRLVLVKSVGCGWLGYHAFLLGHRLAERVPPMLGLREGMLYSEWVGPLAPENADGRAQWPDRAATYVADRVRRLPLAPLSAGRTRLDRHENALKLLARALSRAHGAPLADVLARPGVERMLAGLPCPCPTLIDGRMDLTEWVAGPRHPLKIDYEHHGLGKGEANVVDPAYDLASLIMYLELSADEEKELVRRYEQLSGDVSVHERLFLNKIAAGLWAMHSAWDGLLRPTAAPELQSIEHGRFMAGWSFLTIEAARFCGRRCRPGTGAWSSPLVLLDVDGVIDRRIFGFPCTTQAGIDAISLLHEHGLPVAMNTARSASEVKAYCDAYSLAGGVAEHGTYLWDAIGRRERILPDPDEMRQLAALRNELSGLPGVFLDARHRCSIRAFTYVGKPTGLRASLLQSSLMFNPAAVCQAPLPELMVEQWIARLGLDRLAVHNTTMDTTVTIGGHDKGTGLAALRDWVVGPDAETIAVGDSAPDLQMFRHATRSFAPSHLDCQREARLLGCRVAARPYQRGLLEIARMITQTGQSRSDEANRHQAARPSGDDLFLGLLREADRPNGMQFARLLLDPRSFKALVA